MSRGKKKSSLSFEESLKKLEAIVARLEEEEVPLEESLRLFAEGRTLARDCERELAEAESKVRQLTEDTNGDITEAPFEPEGSETKSSEDDDEDGEEEEPPKPEKKSGAAPGTKDDLPF